MGQTKSKSYSSIQQEDTPRRPGLGICAEEGCRAYHKYKDTPYCYFHACKHDSALNEERLRKTAETKAKKAAEPKPAPRNKANEDNTNERISRRKKEFAPSRPQQSHSSGLSRYTPTLAISPQGVGMGIRPIKDAPPVMVTMFKRF